MKAKFTPATCPHCLSLLNEVIAEFVYFNCSSSFNIDTQIVDRSKKCIKQEKLVGDKLLELLKKYNKKV